MRTGPILPLALGSALLCAGCAAPHATDSTLRDTPDRSLTPPRGSFPIEPGTGLARLEALASEDAQRPRWLPDSSPVWNAYGVTPSQPVTSPTDLTLDQMIARLQGEALIETPPPPPVDPEDVDAAVFLLEGAAGDLQTDAQSALDASERAAALDPTNQAAQDLRAAALLKLGRRGEAGQAAQLAIELGSMDPLSLTVFGVDRAREGEHQTAARALARALIQDPTDPSLGAVALATLGESLQELGAADLGREAIRRSLSQPPRPEPDTPLRAELIRFLGRRDALLEDAAGAPQRELSVLDQRIARLVAQGQPIRGFLLIQDQSPREASPISVPQQTLIRSLAEDDTLRPLISDALRSAADQDELPPSVRDGLLVEGARLAPEDLYISSLRDALRRPGFSEPVARALVADERLDIAQRVEIAASIVREEPRLARRLSAALLAGAAAPTRVRDSVQDLPPSVSGDLLRAGLDIQLRRARDAFALLENSDARSVRAGRQMYVEAAVSIGRWEIVPEAIESLRAGGVDATLVRALRAAHRFEEAARFGESLPTQEQLDVDLLIELAELSILLARPRDAELYLEMASELDPFDERVLVAQLGLYAPGAPLEGEAQHARALRAIRERRPNGTYASLLRAQELATSGLLEDAQSQLRILAERDPEQRASLELLHQIWLRGAPESQTQAITWLEDLVRRNPGSPAPSGALARLLASSGRLDEATTVLDACERDAAAPVMARLRERLLRDAGQQDRADQLTRERLTLPTRSIDESLELGELEIGRSNAQAALNALRRDLPQNVTLTNTQRARLIRIASLGVASLGSMEADSPQLESVGRDVLQLIDLTLQRTPSIPWTLHSARITLSALEASSSPASISEVCEQAIAAAPERAGDAYRTAIRSLIARSRISDSIEVAGLGVVRDRGFDEELFTDAISIAAQAGEADDARRLISTLGQSNVTADAARALRPDPDTPLDTPEAQRAEIAYHIASVATFFGREALAEQAYRLSLEHDPDHAWSNNDLGYMLVDQNSDIAEGERLIARAYERLPNSHNVTDSLAWARYKLGQFSDREGSEGAITLLRRAIRLQDEAGQDNATLHDHLGDALWRVGDPNGATESWLNAETIALDQSRELRRNGGGAAVIERLESRLRSVRQKLRASQVGERPPVAPIADELSEEDPAG